MAELGKHEDAVLKIISMSNFLQKTEERLIYAAFTRTKRYIQMIQGRK